ncbi:unnamed protein product, partial [Plutella xylostella]
MFWCWWFISLVFGSFCYCLLFSCSAWFCSCISFTTWSCFCYRL